MGRELAAETLPHFSAAGGGLGEHTAGGSQKGGKKKEKAKKKKRGKKGGAREGAGGAKGGRQSEPGARTRPAGGDPNDEFRRPAPSACCPARSREAQSGAGSARHRPPPGSRKPGQPQGRREGGGGRRGEAPEEAARPPARPPARRSQSRHQGGSRCSTMTGIAAASFFSNTCRFGGCGLHFPTLADLIEHIEDNHIDTDPRVLEKQELQQPTYVALSYINRFMTDAARREQETLKKKIQPKLSLTLSSSVTRGNVSTPPRHSSGSLTPPVTPPITPSSSFRSSTPTGSEYDEEEVDYEESDSDESWTTESAISSEAILSSMCMNGGEEKPFACPVPGCKKRYKNVNGIKYHAKNGHRTQIRVRKPFKCRCGKSYKTAQGLRHHTINFHPPVSAEMIRKMQQ